jgi:hypothetical protein
LDYPGHFSPFSGIIRQITTTDYFEKGIFMQTIFYSNSFKTFLGIGIVLAWVAIPSAFGAGFFHKDPDIVGKIIDYDTKEPIEGVVVMALWTTDVFRLTIEPDEKYYDYFETLSDKDGEFRIPGKGPFLLRDINPPDIEIFKTGYLSIPLHDLGPMFMDMSPFSRYVQKIDGKFIISFKKRSMEERKESIREYRGVPFSEMAKAAVSPQEYRLYEEELKRAYKALGKTPYWEQNHLQLRYKKGGVYPAQEKAVKPARIE